jgi:acyl dehydratase
VRYWEDFHVGDVAELGEVTVTRDEIVEFARRYDPQPFHVDEAAAADGPFAGLVASGWHTAALFMGLFVRGILLDAASMGSPGVDELRWPRPVRPGDTLRQIAEVLELRPSRSKPDRGIVVMRHAVVNQRDEEVMTYRCMHLLARRPA